MASSLSFSDADFPGCLVLDVSGFHVLGEMIPHPDKHLIYQATLFFQLSKDLKNPMIFK